MNKDILNNSKTTAIKYLDDFRGRFYDFVHNVDTFSFVSRTAVKVESKNKEFGLPYQRTNVRTMNTLFKHLVWEDGTTFIDFGCGKGLTLLAAAKYPFERIVGVEYASDLVSIARQNVLHYVGALPSRKSIEIIHGDVTQFELPDAPLICYFYNPFRPVIMEKVLDNIVISCDNFPREIHLVFHIRYSKDLVESKFEVLDFKRIPYFHIYRVEPAKIKPEKISTRYKEWETIDTESEVT